MWKREPQIIPPGDKPNEPFWGPNVWGLFVFAVQICIVTLVAYYVIRPLMRY
jgi:hypothetical protein